MNAPIMLLIVGALAAGCRSPGDVDHSGNFWKSYRSFDAQYSYPANERKESIGLWNGWANDKTVDRESRSEEAFLIFKVHVRPGFTSADCGKVLGQANWLGECRVERVGGLGGWVPVDLSVELVLFHMVLFPDENGISKYHMYFTLSGVKGEEVIPSDKGAQFGVDFLRGRLRPGVRLREFALCYPPRPLAKTQRFTRQGVELLRMD